MVLFGSINKKHEFVNWINVNVKIYIYRTKLQKKILNTIGIKVLKYIFYKRCLHKECDENWVSWKIFLENII